ncbi:Os08g0391800, partial [Oryza sativa Japonica Group]
RNSPAVVLLYTAAARAPPPPTTTGTHGLVDAYAWRKKHATDTRAGPAAPVGSTRCSTLRSLSFDTSWRRSPTFTTSAPATGGTSTHRSSGGRGSTACRPPEVSCSSTVRKLGSECLVAPIVASGSGHAG